MADSVQQLWKGFEGNPSDTRQFIALHSALVVSDDVGGIVRLLVKRAEHSAPLEAVSLLLSVAEHWSRDGTTDEGPRALALAWQRAQADGALASIVREALWKKSLWDQLDPIMDEEASSATTNEDRGLAYLELARFRVARVKNLSTASEAYERAVRESMEVGDTCRLELTDLCRDHPADESIVRALSQVVELQGRSEDLAELLRLRVTLLPADATATRRDLLLELTAVLAEQLGDPRKALDTLREAAPLALAKPEVINEAAKALLTGTAADVPVLQFLGDRAERSEAWPALVETLEQRAGFEPESDHRAKLLRRAGDILWEKLAERERALACYQKAAQADPAAAESLAQHFQRLAESTSDLAQRDELIGRQEALLRGLGRSDSLVRSWESRLASETNAERKFDLLCKLGDAHRTDLRRPEVAYEYYEKATAHVATDSAYDRIVKCLFSLLEMGVRRSGVESLIEKLARDDARWDDVRQLLGAKLDQATTAKEAAALNIQLGQLLTSELEDPVTGLQHFQRAVELTPNDQGTIVLAQRAAEDAGNWELALIFVEAKIRSAEPSEQPRIRLARAELLLKKLNRGTEAVAEVVSVAHDQSDSGLISSAQELVFSDVGQNALVALFDSTAEQVQRSGLASAALVLFSIPVAVEGHALDVLLVIDQHVALDPTNQAKLEKALLGAQRFAELASTLERHVDRCEDLDRQVAVLSNLIVMARHQLKDQERALRSYWQKLRLVPNDWPTIREVVEYLSELGRTSELCQAYEYAASHSAAANKDDLEGMLAAYGGLLANEMGQNEAAATPYYQLLLLNPFHGEALSFFKAYYKQAEDALKFYQVLSQTLGAIDTADGRATRLLELAELATARLGDENVALGHLEELGAMPEAPPSEKATALGLLKSAYTAREDGPNLTRVIRLLLEAEPEGDGRGVLLHELADEYSKLDEWERELEVVDELLLSTPTDNELLERAADIALQVDDAESEADYSRRLAREVPDRPEIAMRLIRVLIEPLHQLDEAQAELMPLLEAKPGDLHVLDVAEELFGQLGTPSEYHQLLIDQCHRDDLDARPALLKRLAETAEFFEPADKDTASDSSPSRGSKRPTDRDWKAWALEELLDLDEEDDANALRLARHYEDKGQWNDAVRIVEHLYLSASEKDEKVALLRQIGSIYEHRLENVSKAQEAYKQVVDLDPEGVGAYRAMLRISRKTGEFEKLPQLTEDIVSRDPSAEDVAELIHGAAEVAVDELGDPTAAITLLTKLVELDPLDKTGLEKLSALHLELEHWTEHADCLDRLASLATNDTTRIDLWSRRARVLEEEVGDFEGAARAWEDVLQIHAGNRLALHALKRIRGVQERWTDVLTLLSRLAALESDPLVRAATLRDAADVYENHLDQPEKAVDLHTKIHSLLVDDSDSLESLHRLAENHGLWKEYVSVLLDDLEHAPTPEEHLSRLCHCATAIEEKLEEPEAAFDLVFSRIEPAPADNDLFLFAVEMATRNGLWEQLETCHVRLLQVTLDSNESVRIYHRWADMLSEAGEPALAFEILRRAHLSQPTNALTFERLETLASSHALWQELADFYGERADSGGALRQRVELTCMQAEVLEKHLEDPDGAFERLVAAFRADPASHDVQANLERLAQVRDDLPSLIEVFELLIEERPERAIRRRLLERLYSLHKDTLDDVEAAFEYAAKAWQEEPGSHSLLETLVQSAHEAKRLDKLAEAFLWAAENRPETEEKVQAWIRLGDLSLGELGEIEVGLEAYRSAFALNPGREETIAALFDGLKEIGQSENYLPTLASWVQYASGPTDRAALFGRIARTAREAGLRDEAIEGYRGVLSNLPADEEALIGLAELHREAQDWDRVFRCMEQLARVVVDEERRLELTREIADLNMKLERFEDAMNVLEGSIDDFPNHSPPIDDLVALYRHTSNAERGIERLERLAAKLDKTASISALLPAAKLAFVDLGDPRRANRLAIRITRLDPNNGEAWALSAEIAESGGQWKDVSDAWLKLAAIPHTLEEEAAAELVRKLHLVYLDGDFPGFEETPAPAQQALYQGLAAAVQERRLLYRERAETAWQTTKELDSSWLTPLLPIAKSAAGRKDWEGAQSTLNLVIEALTPEGPSRALSTALKRLAEAQRRANANPSVYAETLRRAVVAAPSDHETRAEYLELAEGSGLIEQAGRVLETLRAQSVPADVRQPILVESAAFEERRGEQDTADAFWEEALSCEDASNGRSGERLASYALRKGDPHRALSLVQPALAELDTGASNAGISIELRHVIARAAELTGDIPMAQEHFTQIYAASPEDCSALLGLARLALHRGAHALADQYLQDASETGKLAEEEANQLQYLLAQVALARGQIDKAISAAEELTRGESAHATQAWGLLADAWEKKGEIEQVAAALQKQAEIADGPIRVQALIKLSKIQKGRPELGEESWTAIQQAARTEPLNRDILEAAADMALATDRAEQALEFAESLIELSENSSDRLQALSKAVTAANETGSWEALWIHSRALLAEDPFDLHATEGAIRGARAAQDWAGLRDHLVDHLERVGDARPALRGTLLRELASLLIDNLNETEAAHTILDALLELYPDDVRGWQYRIDLLVADEEADSNLAAETVQQLAVLGSLKVDHLLFLRDLYKRDDNGDGCYLITSLLAAIGEATEADRWLLRASDRAQEARLSPVAPAQFESHLRVPPVEPALLDRFRACGAATAVLAETPELPHHDLSSEFGRVFDWLGSAPGLVLSDNSQTEPLIIHDQPPVVVAADTLFESLPVQEKRFQLGVLATQLRPEFVMTAVLDEFRYVGFHEAVLEPLLIEEAEFGRDRTVDGWVSDWRQVFAQRNELSVAEARTHREHVPSPADWRSGARRTALRVGLTWCDSIAAALGCVLATSPGESARLHSFEDLAGSLGRSTDVRELVSFLLSESYTELRASIDIARGDFTLDYDQVVSDQDLSDVSVAEFELSMEDDGSGAGPKSVDVDWDPDDATREELNPILESDEDPDLDITTEVAPGGSDSGDDEQSTAIEPQEADSADLAEVGVPDDSQATQEEDSEADSTTKEE